MPYTPVNQVDLWYERSGKGRAVVFLHAFAVSGAMWQPQVDRLAGKGCDVIRVDLRGHGRSSSPPAPYTIDQIAKDIVGLIEHLELEDVCLVGLSTGGRVATHIAINYPESIAKLVLVSTKSEPAREIINELAELNSIAESGNLPLAVSRWYQGHYKRLEDAAPQLYQALIDEWAGRPASGFVGAARAITEMESVTALIPKIHVPTLAVAGEQDTACQPYLAWYERSIPDCRGVIIPYSGHFVNIEQPQKFNDALLDFLSHE
jgi:3-oxoadipate enol-lactonase